MSSQQDWRAAPRPLRHGTYVVISLALVFAAAWMIDQAHASPFESNLALLGFLGLIIGWLGVAANGAELLGDILKLALDNRGEQ